MTPLVTFSDLLNYKYIADSVVNSVKWPLSVSVAQMLDVKVWLGDALLLELIGQSETSPESISAKNKTLLNGGSYTYQDNAYFFQGLKACIIYYAWSRFISRMPFNFTQAGITIKDSDLSTPASTKDVQRLSTEAMLTASALKDEVLLYLKRNSKDYPLFKTGMKTDRPRTFFVIGE
jgi:hypothetical protein